jgi:pyruvate/2-oxoglutarate dehydrogenase complex dihydrolipoamide acyltransferase (E2) component
MPFPAARRFVVMAMRAGRRGAPMHGLVEVDITEAMNRIRNDRDATLTAFLIASVGRAAAQHPGVHAYRDFLGRLVHHEEVSISTIVEVETADGPFPLAHVILDAHERTVRDIAEEIRAVKSRPLHGRSGRRLQKLAGSLSRVPLMLRLFYWLVSRSVAARHRVGTVTLTSVGMFLGGSGHGIGVQTIMPLTVLIGGVQERPWVVDGEIAVRRILDLTVSIDHNVVDGAPAARFGATLRELLETGAVLGE